MRYLEATLATLPPRVAAALHLAWRSTSLASHACMAEQLSACEDAAVSTAAVRQRVSRGVRLLERAIQARVWNRPTGSRRRR